MKLYALTPIKHDGKRCGEGDPFDCTKEQAEHLLAAGYASKRDPKADDEAETEEKPDAKKGAASESEEKPDAKKGK